MVELNNSCLVDHATFPSSAFTSLMKFTGSSMSFIFQTHPFLVQVRNLQERQDCEPVALHFQKSYRCYPENVGKIFPHTPFGSSPQTTGAAGLEPAVTVLETVGLPLTDAPILFYFSVGGMLVTEPTELAKLQPILMFLLVFCRRIISILANRAL